LRNQYDLTAKTRLIQELEWRCVYNCLNEEHSDKGFWTDVPVLFTADAPSLGGLVITSTLPAAEFWRVGQIKPGNTIRFRRISFAQARELAARLDSYLLSVAEFVAQRAKSVDPLSFELPIVADADNAVLYRAEPAPEKRRPEIVYRQVSNATRVNYIFILILFCKNRPETSSY
jgi:urea carboxylase